MQITLHRRSSENDNKNMRCWKLAILSEKSRLKKFQHQTYIMLIQQPKKGSELNYSELTFVRGETYFSFRFIKISAATYLLKKELVFLC